MNLSQRSITVHICTKGSCAVVSIVSWGRMLSHLQGSYAECNTCEDRWGHRDCWTPLTCSPVLPLLGTMKASAVPRFLLSLICSPSAPSNQHTTPVLAPPDFEVCVETLVLLKLATISSVLGNKSLNCPPCISSCRRRGWGETRLLLTRSSSWIQVRLVRRSAGSGTAWKFVLSSPTFLSARTAPSSSALRLPAIAGISRVWRPMKPAPWKERPDWK